MIKTFKLGLGILFGISLQLISSGQQIIPLYDGKRPQGSELLNLPERQEMNDKGELFKIYNTSMPSLTVFKPEKGSENGTAVIVCPGGAFLFIEYDKEGVDVARWLVSKGITAFVLKYRITPSSGEFNKAPSKDSTKRNAGSIETMISPYVPLAVADGREAVKYVRQHASEYGIETNRIGMIGFSAGGALIGSVAQNYEEASRPDFVAPIYPFCNAMLNNKVPTDAPPMFLALASDDPIAKGSTALFEKWRDAGRQAEIHIFHAGGHAFGVEIRNKPTDGWMPIFEDWLLTNGYIRSSDKAKTIKY